mmetsp:Transcript_25223/g.82800  ORF Transcript_25223/g.82800 Transcript_25223/m.82800 type:complete len:218 (-) Transcript_25223:676-1329(-)
MPSAWLGMIWSPPGCSPSHRVTSSTIESMMSSRSPAAFRASTSEKGTSRSRSLKAPSLASERSCSHLHPSSRAASESSSSIRIDHSGRGLPSASASRLMSTRSKQSVPIESLAATPVSPPNARRTCFVSAMHERKRRASTGNSSPLLPASSSAASVVTMVTVGEPCAGRRRRTLTRRKPPPSLTHSPASPSTNGASRSGPSAMTYTVVSGVSTPRKL